MLKRFFCFLLTLTLLAAATFTLAEDAAPAAAEQAPVLLATVNGEPVKVYATGAFGKELRLKNGDNRIEVVLSRGSEKQTQEVNVYYAPPQGLVSRPVPEPEL